eukprot:8696068-Prorocentrum_lima.AAC.1
MFLRIPQWLLLDVEEFVAKRFDIGNEFRFACLIFGFTRGRVRCQQVRHVPQLKQPRGMLSE